MRWKLLQAVIMLSLALGAPSGALAFTFTAFDVPGATVTEAFGINDAGQIVGGFIDATTGEYHSFLKDGGTFTTIEVPGAPLTVASGINDTGQIVGSFAAPDWHSFLKDGATFTTIDVPGATYTRPMGINAAGQIVGDFVDGTGGHSFLKDGATFTTIDVPGATLTLPQGINDAGQIVGFFDDATGVHGFVATATMSVAVDIKPQACPNPLNTNARGVLVVAILGTSTFDVTQVDPASVKLTGVPPLRSSLQDVATPFVPFTGKTAASDCTTLGSDGFVDLTLQFDTQAVVTALGPVTGGQALVLQLTGNLKPQFGSTLIVGEDVVVMKKK